MAMASVYNFYDVEELVVYDWQIEGVDWPFQETDGSASTGVDDSYPELGIADYLSRQKFDLVINLPMRNRGSRRPANYVTWGYRTRRMAVDYSVPLITDIKCAKLFVKVDNSLAFMYCFVSEFFNRL